MQPEAATGDPVVRDTGRPGPAESAGDATPACPFAEVVRECVARTVIGQETVVERILIALLTGGHLLLEGVPGIAKTLLVKSVSSAIDLRFGRVQFTIDLLPSDIIGSEILDQSTGKFRVHKGPIFTNLLLADEINRASPKVQSALLEAMQERKVTIGDESFSLPAPFLVIATQNPVEQSGTFDLPEAQLDRFMLRHQLGYPSSEDEAEIVRRQLALKLKRMHTGLQQRELALLIGMRRVRLCEIENGGVRPKPEELKLIREGLVDAAAS